MPDKELMSERKRWGFLGLPFTFTKYIITDKKLLIETGFFTSNENEILLYKVIDMKYSRSLGQKMFGLGTIKLFSQDVTNPELEIKNIKHSREFKDLLSEQSELEKQRLSVRRGEFSSIPHNDHMHHTDLPDDDFNDSY